MRRNWIKSREYFNVSIHASVKDATKTDISRCISITSFNPRICKRCDLICPLSNMADKDGFNPRICKRCDKRRLILFSIIGSFNPRICKRCDLVPPNSSIRIKPVSIHASVKDATPLRIKGLLRVLRFNPRICKRCDPISPYYGAFNSGFNPRICKRCDTKAQAEYTSEQFQSTHL